jgi:endonuclease
MRRTAAAKHRQNRRELRLENALCSDLGCLEAGLTIINRQEMIKYPGGDRESNPGRVDVLAKDKRGRRVVIELKPGEVGRRAIGQILGYMGALMAAENERVRGILVAEGFSPQGRAAARPVQALKLIPLKSLRLKIANKAK